MLTGFLLGLAIIVMCLMIMIVSLDYINCPPTVPGHFIMGIIPKITKEFHLMLYDYSRRYGSIFRIHMGMQTMVVISDPNLIRQAFRNRDLTARPKNDFSTLLNGFGIINSQGNLWKSHRHFLSNNRLGMQDWQSGLSAARQIIEFEGSRLLDVISREFGPTPTDPEEVLNSCVANVICSLVMSTRFDHKDKKFKDFMNNFDEGFRLFNKTGASLFFPFVKLLPGVRSTYNKLKDNREVMRAFAREIIDKHSKNLDPENPKDLIDHYLIKMGGKQEAIDALFHGFDPQEQLEQVILDLFSAGVETIKVSLLWSIIYLTRNPDVQKKVQAELDSVVGSERNVAIDDLPELTYTKATIFETLRRSSVVPLGTTHVTNRTVQLNGYTIPKNTQVIPLLHSVHMNPDVWDEPEAFRPERFLSEDGSQVIKPSSFMPFSVGQRMCLGDQLAEKEFLFFFASLFHAFNICPAQGQELPSLAINAGATVRPNAFKVQFVPRQKEALVHARNNVMESDVPFQSSD
ncbi:hypothetical protein TCAL_10020 [Tigriopus californicus]|uniref:Cytochrome P450 n=1 Tax=Tigriopus californicus TaxID=6832 RepID=A0A553NX25_TIGCA|nr:cytochrome P450 18a1-like [Tigriopus californicus]TRY69986.1 hypothetical protein TCAL_10020 [Tigriopus californicus]